MEEGSNGVEVLKFVDGDANEMTDTNGSSDATEVLRRWSDCFNNRIAIASFAMNTMAARVMNPDGILGI